MTKHLAMVLLLIGAAARAAADDRWTEVRSPNFVVLTNSGERQARHVAGQLERMRSVFLTLIPSAPADAGAPITVLALKNKQSLQSLEPQSYLAKGQLDLAGLFITAPDRNYILLRLDAEGEHPFATVYHEYTHFMLRHAEWLPLWLNEGLAQFYQNTEIEDKEVRLGEVSANDILFLRGERLLPLPTLFKVDYNSPYYHQEDKGSIFYAEAWALTHYLEITSHDNHTRVLNDYASYLIAGEDPVAAAQHAFGDLNKLQRQLEIYIRQGDFKMFSMNSAIRIDESSFRPRSVAAPEANAIRAEVLVADYRTRDAKMLLDAALQDDPHSAPVHRAIGFLDFREGNYADAAKSYGEALQLGANDYLTNYYFASMSLRAGNTGQDDAVEKSLHATIASNPKFAPAYDSLAMFYGEHREKLDEAHLLNVQATVLDPGNLFYRLNTASVLITAENCASAIAVLKAAMPLAKTPEQRAMVEEHIARAKNYQEALDRVNRQNSEASIANSEAGSAIQLQPGRVPLPTGQDAAQAPKFPDHATGPRHKASGVLRQVRCFYPAVMTASLDAAGKSVTLYSNNYFKLDLSAANYTPAASLNPCKDLEGMKARVDYAETQDKASPGQIISMLLSK